MAERLTVVPEALDETSDKYDAEATEADSKGGTTRASKFLTASISFLSLWFTRQKAWARPTHIVLLALGSGMIMLAGYILSSPWVRDERAMSAASDINCPQRARRDVFKLIHRAPDIDDR